MDSLPLSTADVPPQFLRAAFMVGPVPRRALASDPRLSYSIYIPEAHYNPSPGHMPEPSTSASLAAVYARPRLPLLVTVHGTGRAVTTIHQDLVPVADGTPCAVLAPLFPAALDGPLDLDSYQLLRSATLRADLALLAMLAEVGEAWPGIDTRRVYLMGFSGGGQFAHRFLYLHPERLAAVSVGAPGRVTRLDAERAWPEGVGDVEELFGRVVDKAAISRVKIQLVVGEADVGAHGGQEFWDWVQKMKANLGKGGQKGAKRDAAATETGDEEKVVKDRRGTLNQLKAEWEKVGIEAQLDVVQGAAHENLKVLGHVVRFMQPLLQQHKA